MVLMPEPVFRAVEAVEAAEGLPRPLLLLGPGGRRFDQAAAAELAGLAGGFSLLCGRYEGVDQRVVDHLVDGELSIGDVVLAGGEAAALVVIEAVARLVPGTMGNQASGAEESFEGGCWSTPTTPGRPSSGAGRCPRSCARATTAAVARWRRAEALRRTLARRPDLIAGRGGLSEEEAALVGEGGEVRPPADHGYHGPPGSPSPSSKDAPDAAH